MSPMSEELGRMGRRDHVPLFFVSPCFVVECILASIRISESCACVRRGGPSSLVGAQALSGLIPPKGHLYLLRAAFVDYRD